MLLPKILIYKDRLSLDEFRLDEEGGTKDMFGALRKCEEVVWEHYSDNLESQYLSIFNAAYYICADMMRCKHPELKTKEYADYIQREVKGHYRKVEGVLCLTRALTLNHPSTTFRQNMKDEVRRLNARFYDVFFTSLPASFHDHYPEIPLPPPALTKDYLERNRKKMHWKEWTDGFSDAGIWNLVQNVGTSKQEKLNLLNAIEEDVKKNGYEDAHEVLFRLYDELGSSLDSPVVCRDDKKVTPVDARLEERLAELEEENRRLKEECNRMEERIRELEQQDASVSDEKASMGRDIPDSVRECFKKADEYVREKVERIVKECYEDKPVNLALIEQTLYDHNAIKKRNTHRLFVQSLMDWGILSGDTNIGTTANGMSQKSSNFPKQIGYKEWGKKLADERSQCFDIASKLPDSMGYKYH